MAEEVSNKTIAILVAVVLVISVVGTWTLLSQEGQDLSWYNPGESNEAGQVQLYNQPNPPTPEGKAEVSITKTG